VIFWAKAIIREVDCSGGVSVLAAFGAGAAAPFVSTSLCRRDEKAEKDRRFCFLISASVGDEELLEWNSELNLSLAILKSRCLIDVKQLGVKALDGQHVALFVFRESEQKDPGE
jgi:hypothetical protein